MTDGLRAILVPLDGSSLAEQALPLAVAIAHASGATLQLTNVFVPYTERMDVPGVIASDTTFERGLQDAAREYLREVAARVGAEVPEGVECKPVRAQPIRSPFSESAAVVEALRRSARRAQADIIVMATHGRGGLSRAWLGSVADALVRRAARPVLLVRPREDSAAPAEVFRHILVPLDGSSLAERILPAVTALASVGDARVVTLLRVIVPRLAIARSTLAAGAGSSERARRQAKAAEYLAHARERFGGALPHLETATVVAEQPARAILRWAEEHAADLIAMTTHGLSGLKRLTLGSVADKVVRGALVPVLILGPDRR